MIKIVIADDHKLFRTGLSELLKKQEDISVVAEFSNGIEFIEFVKTKPQIDIVLLDISMPQLDGFGVLDKLHKINSEIKSIIISMYDDGNYIAKSVKSGAYGYLLKNADEKELIKTIKIVAKGRKFFGEYVTEKMINFISSNPSLNKDLSNRESEILQFISKGFTTKEIASKLFVSARTVETHRANILKKLKVKNTASLIREATKAGLIK